MPAAHETLHSMNGARTLLYAFGALLVIAGIVLLFFETGLAAWVPPGIAVAGLVILIGVAVMGLSERGPTERREETKVEEHHHHRD